MKNSGFKNKTINPISANNSNLEPNTNDFFNAKKVFEAIRKDYKKKGGKELTLDEINKIIYGK